MMKRVGTQYHLSGRSVCSTRADGGGAAEEIVIKTAHRVRAGGGRPAAAVYRRLPAVARRGEGDVIGFRRGVLLIPGRNTRKSQPDEFITRAAEAERGGGGGGFCCASPCRAVEYNKRKNAAHASFEAIYYVALGAHHGGDKRMVPFSFSLFSSVRPRVSLPSSLYTCIYARDGDGLRVLYDDDDDVSRLQVCE